MIRGESVAPFNGRGIVVPKLPESVLSVSFSSAERAARVGCAMRTKRSGNWSAAPWAFKSGAHGAPCTMGKPRPLER